MQIPKLSDTKIISLLIILALVVSFFSATRLNKNNQPTVPPIDLKTQALFMRREPQTLKFSTVGWDGAVIARFESSPSGSTLQAARLNQSADTVAILADGVLRMTTISNQTSLIAHGVLNFFWTNIDTIIFTKNNTHYASYNLKTKITQDIALLKLDEERKKFPFQEAPLISIENDPGKLLINWKAQKGTPCFSSICSTAIQLLYLETKQLSPRILLSSLPKEYFIDTTHPALFDTKLIVGNALASVYEAHTIGSLGLLDWNSGKIETLITQPDAVFFNPLALSANEILLAVEKSGQSPDSRTFGTYKRFDLNLKKFIDTPIPTSSTLSKINEDLFATLGLDGKTLSLYKPSTNELKKVFEANEVLMIVSTLQ